MTHCNRPSLPQQRRLAKQVQKIDANHYCRHAGARDHLVRWLRPARPDWMSRETYCSHPQTITVREVKVGKKVLVTTPLSPRKTAKADLEALFLQRWHVELDLRNIKTTLGMEALSCRRPQMCEKEMWVYLLAYNLIRLLMAEAALQAGVRRTTRPG